MNDSGGARVQEGIDSLAGYASVFYNNVMLSGTVPQISIICGPCAGGAAYSPALTDFIILTRGAQMFITGPQVIKQVTGESVTADQLGGPAAQMNRSGVVHLIAEDDEGALALARRLLSFLPSNNLEDPPRLAYDQDLKDDPALNDLVPTESKVAYDIRTVLKPLLDHQDFFEIQPGFAANAVIGFGRIQGRTVGIVSNQPAVLAGALDIDASSKIARFIRFCNAFNIPLLTFVDVPGFLPGVEQEYGGIIRHGAKILFAYSAATVPKITVVLRKAYGGAYIGMCCKDLGADRVVAWPTAEIAVMGAEGAAEIVFRHEIDGAEDKVQRRNELIELYRKTFANPYVSAGRRLVDDVIEPSPDAAISGTSPGSVAYQARASSGQETRVDTPMTRKGASDIECKASSSAVITPKTLSVIAAAVTEFLGKTVRIRAIRTVEERAAVGRWVRQGRVLAQNSHNIGREGR